MHPKAQKFSDKYRMHEQFQAHKSSRIKRFQIILHARQLKLKFFKKHQNFEIFRYSKAQTFSDEYHKLKKHKHFLRHKSSKVVLKIYQKLEDFKPFRYSNYFKKVHLVQSSNVCRKISKARKLRRVLRHPKVQKKFRKKYQTLENCGQTLTNSKVCKKS